MRLWHVDLLPLLPRPQLLGQHRECCALRGLGWGRPHSTVNYVFTHPRSWLVRYHLRVIAEMAQRGYRVDPRWLEPDYRGKIVAPQPVDDPGKDYPEHNTLYMTECLENLRAKRVNI